MADNKGNDEVVGTASAKPLPKPATPQSPPASSSRKSSSRKASSKPAAASSSSKGKAVELREAHTLEDAVEVGLLGVEVDPTPNANYTVGGVIAGKPVPETNAEALALATETARKAEQARSRKGGDK